VALPAHLEKFDSLLDLLADVIAGEIEEEEAPAGTRPPASANQQFHDERSTGRVHDVTGGHDDGSDDTPI
jgi:hypothetical protein